MAATDWNSEYFDRIRTMTVSEGFSKNKAWLSWHELQQKDHPDVLKLAIKAGRLRTRKHENLDHDDPDVQALPAELQLEHQWYVDEEANATTWSKQLSDKDFSKPEEEKPEEAAIRS